MPFGILDTQYIDFPPGIDAAYLQGLVTRAGVAFPRVLSELDQRLAAANATIDPLVASLIAPPTTEQWVDNIAPANFIVEESSEYTISRPQLVEGQAMMLPLRKVDIALGFTEEGLERMSLSRILTNIDSMIGGLKRYQRLAVLRRLFSIAEVRVDPATSAMSAGFAGSGSGYNVFNRAYPDGTALPGGYSHYYRDTQANLIPALKTARDRLKKWYPGPYDLIAPQAQIDLIAADPAFVSAGSALIRPAQGTAEALVDTDKYIGVFDKDVRVQKALLETTDANVAIFKSFGNLNPQNPLAWRYDELAGKNAFVKSRALFPLDNAVLMQRFGIGVNNRVAVVLLKLAASGNYTDPTFA